MTKPIAFGTGLIAMDLIVDDTKDSSPVTLAAGGTCGNILSILAFLGWESHAISRLGNDLPSRRVRDQLRSSGVSLDFASLKPQCETPVILQVNSLDAAGQPTHRFSTRCPDCGGWLPTYRPITLAAAMEVAFAAELLAAAETAPSVFVFDRVSPAALLLADTFCRLGALIVFEPTGFADAKLFGAALRLAHVVKYANDKARKMSRELAVARQGHSAWLLEIETLGGDGLRYRAPNMGLEYWQHLPATRSPAFRDSAGAGDWCTAVLLDRIARAGVVGLRRTKANDLERHLAMAQAYASLSCGFVGPRGMMECETAQAVAAAVNAMINGPQPEGIAASLSGSTKSQVGRHRFALSFCEACT